MHLECLIFKSIATNINFEIQKMPLSLVMGRTAFYQTLNIFEHHFWNINELEHVCLLMIKLEHLNFGFE